MIKDKSIFIKNIYYMLTYAFKNLNQTNYEDIASEEFDSIHNLFAAILSKGISQQLKQGLYKEYIIKQENLSVMRGKLNIQGTIRNKIEHKNLLYCEYDEFSEDNILNQILKTTSEILINQSSVDLKYKKLLKKAMLFLDEVSIINPSIIRWDLLKFNRHNRNYQMMMNICYFVLDGLLQTTDKGHYRMKNFSDEHMSRLYEKFVLEYYKQHHKYLKTYSSQIKWNLDGDIDESIISFLPIMHTDITIKSKKTNKILIIDTKYYTRTLQSQFNSYTLHSNNLYQIFTYVKNKDIKGSGDISGLLLYAKTDEDITPDCEFSMGGNIISVKTLDLNKEFSQIKYQLDKIVESYFDEVYT